MTAPTDIPKVLEQDVSLILVDARSYQKIILKVLAELVTKKKMKGIYVGLNKPYKSLRKFFSANKIDTRQLFFIDTLSEESNKEENAAYAKAENLNEISVKINQAMKKSNSHFILFDTIDTFLVYNQKTSLERFFSSLVSNLRNMNKKCVMIGIKEALLEHMLHVSMERLSDGTVDLVPNATDKFEKTFLKL
jgi:archaellum biogenesis ATPase FlaH